MPGSVLNDRPQFFYGYAGEEALRTAYSELLQRLQAGELAALHYEEMHTDSTLLKGMATIEINKTDRLLIKPITVNHKQYYLILEAILFHRHDKATYLNGTVLEKEIRYITLLNSLKDRDFVSFASLNTSENTPTTAPKDEKPESSRKRAPRTLSFQNGEYLFLTNKQSETLELDLPFSIVAKAGYGKTTLALEYMRRLMFKLLHATERRMLHEIERDLNSKKEPNTVYYLAKNERLVHRSKENYQSHPLLAPTQMQASVRFMTVEDFCQERVLDPKDKQLIPVNEGAFYLWLEQYQISFNNNKKAHLKDRTVTFEIDQNRIFNKPSLLYTELCYMVCLTETEYLASGITIRGTKDYFTKEERPFLWKLCQDYLMGLKKSGKYNTALNPPALQQECCFAVIADEIQIWSPKEIEIIKAVAQNNRILALYGENQSSMICNRTYLSALGLPEVTFNQSLRNPALVTRMANNATLAQRAFGNQNKNKGRGEAESELMEPNEDIEGEIFWADGLEVPDAMLGDLSITVVAPPEYVSEAKKKFNNPPFEFPWVYTPKQIQGTDCDNLVLYRMTSAPVFDYISEHLPVNWYESSDSRAKSSQGLEQKFATGEIHSAFNDFHIALTRATKGKGANVTIFEEKSHKKERLYTAIKTDVPLKPLSYQEEKAPAFNATQCLARAKKEFKEGHEEQALDSLNLLQQQCPKDFDTKRVQAIQASWQSQTATGNMSTSEDQKRPPKAQKPKAPPQTMQDPGALNELNKVPDIIKNKYLDRSMYINEKTVLALLDQTHCTALLFASTPDQTACLFDYFMKDANRAQLFKQAFARYPKKYKDKIPVSKLSIIDDHKSHLTRFAYNDASVALFIYLVKECPGFAEGISPDMLFTRALGAEVTITLGVKTIDACHLFASTSQGTRGLLHLFLKNKRLLPQMPAAFFQGSFLVQLFLGNPAGRSILDIMADEAPQLFRAISDESFDLIHRQLPEKTKTKYRSLREPTTAASEDPSLKSPAPEIAPKKSVKKSKELVTKEEKQENLADMLVDADHFWSYFQDEYACHTFLSKMKADTIAQWDPSQLVTAITSKAEYRRSFCKLGQSAVGKEIIKLILKANKEWAKHLPWYYWLMKFDVYGLPLLSPPLNAHDNQSIAFYLPSNIKNNIENYLKNRLQGALTLVESIQFSNFLMEHPCINNLEMYWYLAKPENIEIALFSCLDNEICLFEKIISNPNFRLIFLRSLENKPDFLKIVAKYLCKPYPGAPAGSLTVLFDILFKSNDSRSLSGSVSGTLFLKKVMELVPDFRMTREAFYQQDRYNRSIFFFLSYVGEDLLISFLGKKKGVEIEPNVKEMKHYEQSDLFDNIPRKCLFSFILKDTDCFPGNKADPYENTSTFSLLIGTSNRRFLSFLKDLHLFPIDNITTKDLFKMRGPNADPISLLHQLATYNPRLMLWIFQTHKHLPMEFPEIAWLEKFPGQYNFFSKPCSLLDLLAQQGEVYKEIYALLPENIQRRIDDLSQKNTRPVAEDKFILLA